MHQHPMPDADALLDMLRMHLHQAVDERDEARALEWSRQVDALQCALWQEQAITARAG